MADGSGVAAGGADTGVAATGGGGGTTDGGAATAATAAGAGTTAVTTTPVDAGPWHGTLDSETVGWLQNKAWFGTDIAKAKVSDAFPRMVASYRGMEKIVGDPNLRVNLPKDIADTEGWNAVYTKLGRPADPAGYELKAGEGGDQKIADAFAELAFKDGLSTRQVQSLAGKWDAFAKEQQASRAAAAEQKFVNTSQAELETLRGTWGGQSDAKFAAAQRAAGAFGMSPETMNKMERAIGTTEFLTVMANIGAMVSEDGGSGMGNPAHSATTPESARATLSERKNDKEWLAKYQAGGSEEVAEFRRLTKIIADAAA